MCTGQAAKGRKVTQPSNFTGTDADWEALDEHQRQSWKKDNPTAKPAAWQSTPTAVRLNTTGVTVNMHTSIYIRFTHAYGPLSMSGMGAAIFDLALQVLVLHKQYDGQL